MNKTHQAPADKKEDCEDLILKMSPIRCIPEVKTTTKEEEERKKEKRKKGTRERCQAVILSQPAEHAALPHCWRNWGC